MFELFFKKQHLPSFGINAKARQVLFTFRLKINIFF